MTNTSQSLLFLLFRQSFNPHFSKIGEKLCESSLLLLEDVDIKQVTRAEEVCAWGGPDGVPAERGGGHIRAGVRGMWDLMGKLF